MSDMTEFNWNNCKGNFSLWVVKNCQENEPCWQCWPSFLSKKRNLRPHEGSRCHNYKLDLGGNAAAAVLSYIDKCTFHHQSHLSIKVSLDIVKKIMIYCSSTSDWIPCSPLNGWMILRPKGCLQADWSCILANRTPCTQLYFGLYFGQPQPRTAAGEWCIGPKLGGRRWGGGVISDEKVINFHHSPNLELVRHSLLPQSLILSFCFLGKFGQIEKGSIERERGSIIHWNIQSVKSIDQLGWHNPCHDNDLDRGGIEIWWREWGREGGRNRNSWNRF